jgi:hypothetical protein
MLQYNLPLAEIATDFHDRVKTLSSGYASFNYEPAGSQVGIPWGAGRVWRYKNRLGDTRTATLRNS